MKAKIIRLPKNTEPTIIEADLRIPLEKCRAILNQKNLGYTDDEVIKIRDFLYHLAALVWEEYQAKEENKSDAKLIRLTKHKTSKILCEEPLSMSESVPMSKVKKAIA
jgi:hypothetical protein